MSNNIKAKSCTIEQDGVEMKLVVGEKYEFLDCNDNWVVAEFDHFDNAPLNPLCTTSEDFYKVREIKASEMRPMTRLEAMEHIARLGRDNVVMVSNKFVYENNAEHWEGWKLWSQYEYRNPPALEYCILENGKLGEPMKLEVEV